jgi:hypothetical protein
VSPDEDVDALEDPEEELNAAIGGQSMTLNYRI